MWWPISPGHHAVRPVLTPLRLLVVGWPAARSDVCASHVLTYAGRRPNTEQEEFIHRRNKRELYSSRHQLATRRRGEKATARQGARPARGEVAPHCQVKHRETNKTSPCPINAYNRLSNHQRCRHQPPAHTVITQNDVRCDGSGGSTNL